jgi:hypothetical protein
VLAAYGNPVTILMKSARATRDPDLLALLFNGADAEHCEFALEADPIHMLSDASVRETPMRILPSGVERVV